MNITNLEITQATIEIFCGFICLMLAVIINMNGHQRKSWKLLKRMFFAVSVIFFSEACAYIFRGNTDRLSLVMTRCSNFVVFFFNIVLISLFMKYMYELLREKGVHPGRIYRNIVRTCMVLCLVILFANPIAGWMYYFDGSNYYHRNAGWYVYMVLSMVCIAANGVMCIWYRRAVKKPMLAALLIYSLSPIIAIIVQAFVYGISITNLGVFVAMLFMLAAYLKEWSTAKDGRAKERKVVEIIILFVIMTVSMSASIISCIISIDRISAKNSQSNSMLIAHMINDRIENEFIKPIMVSETMSNDYSLKEYMKKSGEVSAEAVEAEVAAYFESIKDGFGYPMVYAVCDASRAYYTYDGIGKFIDTENDKNDLWYKLFLEQGKHYDLEVDTDEASQWELSVFINTEILDENGRYLGVCGVGIEMTYLQELLQKFEESYDVKIDLIDKDGLVQVDTDARRIEQAYMDNSYLDEVGSDEFYYRGGKDSSLMTKYLKDLEWYLVVEDNNPDKLNVAEITTSSIVIFLVGLLMMGIVFFIISIRERRASKELMERRKISVTDDMTGLFNRRAYEEDCQRIVQGGLVSKVAIIMMDVNGLKAVNDTFGHMAGDELIIGAAKCILTAMGEYGRVYRTGGDEFVALLECTREQLSDMLQTFEHILESWKGTYQCELTISKGVVMADEHHKLTFDEMKKLADRLMYEDKDEYYRRTGKNRRKV